MTLAILDARSGGPVALISYGENTAAAVTAAASAQAAAAAAQAAAEAALASANYYTTRAAGVAATAVDEVFSSDETGPLVLYRHTGTTPFYTTVYTFSASTASAFGLSLMDDPDAATARTTLGLGTAATLSTGDIDERARDALGTALVAGANITITPNDGADTITIAASGGATYTDEQVRDVMGTALVAGANVTITPNDGSDTITIAASGGGGGGGVGLNVTDYGVVGNDSTNNATDITTAIAAAKAAGVPLFFPAGIYRFGSTLNFEDVGITGEGAEATILKPTHAGIGIQIGLPVGSSSIDTQHRTYERFGILANASTTTALYIMRSIYCRYQGIEIRHPSTIGSSYKSFRLSGATYYNRFESCFSDCTTETVPTVGKGFHIGNGENEVLQEFAACNANTFINCRANRIGVGVDIENASGIVWLGGGMENADFWLRGSGNQILGPWLESSTLITNTFTPANGAGGFGAAQTPSRNTFIAAGPAPHITLTSSTGIDISGTVGNLNETSGAYNTNFRGRINGTFTNNGSDGRFDMIYGGYHQTLIKNGTSIAYHMKADASVTELILPGASERKIRSHSAGQMEFDGGTQPVKITGDVPALMLPETSDPGSAESNALLLFAVDNGSGKTQLKVRFPSGVAQTIATEP